ncbi:hypothetical protein SARC_01761, partial [Sphaeroforma arctica JP610]
MHRIRSDIITYYLPETTAVHPQRLGTELPLHHYISPRGRRGLEGDRATYCVQWHRHSSAAYDNPSTSRKHAIHTNRGNPGDAYEWDVNGLALYYLPRMLNTLSELSLSGPLAVLGQCL